MAKSTTSVSGFRSRLFLMIVLVVAVVTILGAVLAQRYLSKAYEEELRNSIEQQVAAAAHTRQVRQTVLAGICVDLAGQPRIHAALEDNALDLLYPSAANELRQIMRDQSTDPTTPKDVSVSADFYRFLNLQGAVIPPEEPAQHGLLPDQWESKLRLTKMPAHQQIGYFRKVESDHKEEIIEVITVPIVSNETFQPIAALVVGFLFDIRSDFPPGETMTVGIWTDGHAVMPSLQSGLRESLEEIIPSQLTESRSPRMSTIDLAGTAHRLLLRPLNGDSAYPATHEVFLSSLLPLKARQARAHKRILITACIVLAIGLIAANLTARRLARPVEELAVASEEEHQQRISAEVALDSTSRELERAARFSADASHQLKTPVAVVRAGLEELLVDPTLPAQLHEEVHSLIRHTGRLTHVIEDLLLLSRLDAGRLQMVLQPENLCLIIDGQVDDLSILPESARLEVEVEADDPIWIMGNRSYTTLILQSLLENAWKYNRPGGRIRIVVKSEGEGTVCRIGNTGKGISLEMRAHIFERFHRGSSGENVPGYGLGLNLAAELTRLHRGTLDLFCSEEDWTEFRLTLPSAPPPEAEPERSS